MKKIQIWTIQLAKWRALEGTGIKLVDATVKTGIRGLAPSWDMLTAYRQKQLSEAEYTDLYHQRMILSQRHMPNTWKSFLKYDQIAIACYCPPNHFCHRHLLVQKVKEYLEAQSIEVELMGEYTLP